MIEEIYKELCLPLDFLSPQESVKVAVHLECTKDKYLEKSNKIYQKRIKTVIEEVSKINRDRYEDIIKNNYPEGGFFVLLQMPKLKDKYCRIANGEVIKIQGSLDLCKYFLHYVNEQGVPCGVKMAPTSSTGISENQMELRVSVGSVDEKILKKAFQRINDAINTIEKSQEKLAAEYKEKHHKQETSALSTTVLEEASRSANIKHSKPDLKKESDTWGSIRNNSSKQPLLSFVDKENQKGTNAKELGALPFAKRVVSKRSHALASSMPDLVRVHRERDKSESSLTVS